MTTPNFHARTMNIPTPPAYVGPNGLVTDGARTAYTLGHRDARHAAAEIASEADAEIRRLVRMLDEERRTVAKMGHRIDEAHGERDILREQVRSLREQVDDANATIDELRSGTAMSDAAAEVRAAKEESARLVADLRRQEQCAEEVIRRLQSERRAALEEVDALNSDRGAMLGDIMSLRAEVAALTKAAPATTTSDRERFAMACQTARDWLWRHDGGEWRGWSCAVLTGTQEVSSPGWYALPPGQWCGEPHILIERVERDGLELPTVAEAVAAWGVPAKVEE